MTVGLGLVLFSGQGCGFARRAFPGPTPLAFSSARPHSLGFHVEGAAGRGAAAGGEQRVLGWEGARTFQARTISEPGSHSGKLGFPRALGSVWSQGCLRDDGMPLRTVPS